MGGAKKAGKNKRFLVRSCRDVLLPIFVPYVFDVPFFFVILSFILVFVFFLVFSLSFFGVCVSLFVSILSG